MPCSENRVTHFPDLPQGKMAEESKLKQTVNTSRTAKTTRNYLSAHNEFVDDIKIEVVKFEPCDEHPLDEMSHLFDPGVDQQDLAISKAVVPSISTDEIEIGEVKIQPFDESDDSNHFSDNFRDTAYENIVPLTNETPQDNLHLDPLSLPTQRKIHTEALLLDGQSLQDPLCVPERIVIQRDQRKVEQVEESTDNHNATHHPSKEGSQSHSRKLCPDCGMNISATYFRRHSRLHTQDASTRKMFRCEICNKSYTTLQRLTEHNGIHHPSTEAVRSRFIQKCPECGKTVLTRTFKQHMQTHAEGEKVRLEEHIESQHQSKQTETFQTKSDTLSTPIAENEQSSEQASEKSYKCPSKEGSQSHFRKVCPDCGMNISATYFRRHRKLHTQDASTRKIFRCEICNKSYTKLQRLTEHNGIHHPSTEADRSRFIQKCPECGKTVLTRTFKQHMQTHAEGEKVRLEEHIESQHQSKQTETFQAKSDTSSTPIAENEQSSEQASEQSYKCPLKVGSQSHFRKVCPDCGMNVSAKYFKRHSRLHTQDASTRKMFRCEICNKSYTKLQRLTEHNGIHHPSTEADRSRFIQKCPECGKTVLTRTFKQHMQTHAEGEKVRLEEHIESQHQSKQTETFQAKSDTSSTPIAENEQSSEQASEQSYKCPLKVGSQSHFRKVCPDCGMNVSAKYFKRHSRLHTQDASTRKMFRCEICNKSYTKLQRLTEHNGIHHPSTEADRSRFIQKCPECGKTVLTRTFKQHMQTHAEGEKVRLRDHIESQHQSKQTETFQTALDANTLSTPISENERGSEQSYECKECNESFSNKTLLKKHSKTHIQFRCDICNKSYRQNHSLAEHKGIHHPSTEADRSRFIQQCHECGKTVQTRSLKHHMETHAQGEKVRLDALIESQHQSQQTETFQTKSNTLSTPIAENEQSSEQASEQSYKCPSKEGSQSHFRKVCPDCGTTVSAKHFKRHSRLHTQDASTRKMFRCEICNKSYTQKQKLVDHYGIHHPSTEAVRSRFIQKCPECGKTVLTRTFKQHMQTHAEGEKVRLRDHIESQHQSKQTETFQTALDANTLSTPIGENAQGSEQSYECKECNESFSNKTLLKKHSKTHIQFRCVICNKSYKHKLSLKVHNALQHPSDNSKKSFTCNECDKSFCNSIQLKYHGNSQHILTPCPQCKKMVNKKTLKYHLKIKHAPEAKRFRCKLCCKEYKNYCALKWHITLKHTAADDESQKRTYVCEQCNKSFRHKFLWQQHVRSHIQRLCYICGKLMGITVIQRHIDNHLAEPFGGFKCELCNKRYASKSSLTHHISLIHRPADKNPKTQCFRCDQCEKSFASRTQLITHRKNHYFNKCPVCEQDVKKPNFKSHLKKHERLADL